MKNIHVLPTDKKSRILYNFTLKSFCVQKENEGMFINDGKVAGADFWSIEKANNNGFRYVNIYITNDEKIKEGDWMLDTIQTGLQPIELATKESIFLLNTPEQGWKKIILTDNTDLIKDGVQAIDDEFLKWFVKNPSCEKVETYSLGVKNEETGESYHYKYEIIIPKEEPKQELSIRLQNSLKQFNLTLEDAINTEPHRLKQIGFGNRSIIELQSLKSKQEDEFCHYSGLPSPTAYSKSSKLDLVQLDKDIDDILAKETKESLSQWLGDKRRREQTETQEETESKWSLSKAQQFALSKFKGEGNPSKGIIAWESLLEVLKVGVLTGHKFGAKWQQEQNKKLYGEGEVKQIILECCSEISCEDGVLVGKTPEELYKWIEEKFKRN